MNEYEIEIAGTKPPRKPGGWIVRTLKLAGKLVSASLKSPRAIKYALLAAFVLFIGTPHVGWDYECRHPKRAGQTCRAVYYCAYYGIQGRRVVFPEYGETCHFIKLLPIDWKRLIGAIKNEYNTR